MKPITFNKKYLILFVTILLCELYIGFFVHDNIIRPYIGDLLVVILIYAFLKIFIPKKQVFIAFVTFIFACFIEFAQYFNLISLLGLEENKIARVLIGTSFSWIDILAYFGGFLIIIMVGEFYNRWNKYQLIR